MPFELEFFVKFAVAAVGAAVVMVGVLHSARFVLRLARWLIAEVRMEGELLAGEVRESVHDITGERPSTPTGTTTHEVATPTAAHQSAW